MLPTTGSLAPLSHGPFVAIPVMLNGDDGAFGHSNPDVYFLVRPEDRHRLKEKLTSAST